MKGPNAMQHATIASVYKQKYNTRKQSLCDEICMVSKIHFRMSGFISHGMCLAMTLIWSGQFNPALKGSIPHGMCFAIGLIWSRKLSHMLA